MLKQHREFCRAVEELGLCVRSTRMTGKNHLRAEISNGKRTLRYIYAGTPSDWRGIRNALADINRYFKEK